MGRRQAAGGGGKVDGHLYSPSVFDLRIILFMIIASS